MRLFVALRPPDEALADLAGRLPQWPSPPERWHLTLAFLGDVPAVEPVDTALAAALDGAPGVDLQLAGSGTFGRSAVWVGVDGDVDGLQDLARAVRAAARQAGVPLERRRYRPHLTVGRGGRPDPARLTAYRGPAWTAREVELVRSDLGRTVTHTVLARYPLSAGP